MQKSNIFWDITNCSRIEFYRRFGETYCCVPCIVLLSGYLLGLLLNSENGRNTVLRNVDELLPYYVALDYRRYCCS
jgi:hypothetical protein